jgi:hypothetical protein
MVMNSLRAALAVWLVNAACWAVSIPELGTMVEMVPKTQARANAFGEYGFVAIVFQLTEEHNIKPTFVAHSATEFVRRYRRLPAEIQRYPIGLTLAENDPYSPREKAMVEQLKALCKKHSLPLFIQIGHDDRDWEQVSSLPPEKEVRRPKKLRSWSVCVSWSPIQNRLVGTWAMPSFITTDYEDGGPETIISDETVEITFTEDHRYFECIRGEPMLVRGRWCIDGNDLVLQIETQPESAKIPWQRRETIAKVTEEALVFTDGTVEGRWVRVR